MNDLPRTLGPYRLLRRLGYGGMCEVFLAEVYGASGFEKRVAIKTLLPGLRGDGLYEGSLIREACIGANLHHQNLVQIQDFGVDDGIQYIRMDYVEGHDLGQLLRGKPLPAAIALHLVGEVALGLSYLHEYCDEADRPLRLVHRDVSPSNVLVSVHGEVKLTDFGILKATAWADITRGNMRKGKYAYMSPEQLSGEPVTAASDVFSLGVVLAELLSGRRPFEGPDLLQTIDRLKEAQEPDLGFQDEASEEALRPLLERSLARDPGLRFQSGTEFHDALEGLASGMAVVGPRGLKDWLVGCG